MVMSKPMEIYEKRKQTEADKQKAAKVPVWQGVFAYFSNALHAVGTISKFGAAKHNEGVMPTKWRDYPADVYADALARHILVENGGELYDSESNMLHAGHEVWNALARLEKLLEVYPLVKPDGVGIPQQPVKVPTPSTPHSPYCCCLQCVPPSVKNANLNR
jgi:hypothetical protein